jgi:putative hydrolase of the HAD superfamily
MLPPVILLDLDDTILDDTGGAGSSWEQATAEAGAPPELLPAIREAGAWFWSDHDRHRTGRADLLVARRTIVATALERLGLPDDGLSVRIATRLNELRDAAIAPLPGAVEALDELRARGVTLGLITNGSALHQRWKLDRFGLAAHFDYIGIEGEAGIGKPEPEAFLRALRALETDPADAWMVGDNLTYDVGGAQAVGIHAIWLDARGRGLPDPPPAVPDRVIRSIAELLDCVRPGAPLPD